MFKNQNDTGVFLKNGNFCFFLAKIVRNLQKNFFMYFDVFKCHL